MLLQEAKGIDVHGLCCGLNPCWSMILAALEAFSGSIALLQLEALFLVCADGRYCVEAHDPHSLKPY